MKPLWMEIMCQLLWEEFLTQWVCNMQHSCAGTFSPHFFLHGSYQARMLLLYEYCIWGSAHLKMRGCWHLRFTQQLQEAQEAPKGKRCAQRSYPCDSQESAAFRHHWEIRKWKRRKKISAGKRSWYIIRMWTLTKLIIYSFTLSTKSCKWNRCVL